MSKKSNFNLNNLIIFTPMKINFKTMKQSENALHEVNEMDLDFMLSYKLGKIIKTITNELEVFKKIIEKRIKQLGAEMKDEQGNPTGNYKVKDENLDAWEKESDEMLGKEIEIDIPVIKLEELRYKDKEKKVERIIKPYILGNISWLFTE